MAGEAGGFDQVQVFLFLDGAGDAAGIHFGGLLDLFGQLADQDNIGNTEMTAGFEDAVYFLEDAVFVGDEVQHAIGDDDVGDVRGDGHFFDIALAEFDVV
jgi:hypothetical protein